MLLWFGHSSFGWMMCGIGHGGQGLARQKVTETSRKIARIVAKLHEKRGAPARTKKLGRNTAQTKETVPDGKPKSKPDGREILLRAMLTGEGLKEAKT